MYENYADRNIINKMMEETSEEHEGFKIYEKMEYKSQDVICKNIVQVLLYRDLVILREGP